MTDRLRASGMLGGKNMTKRTKRDHFRINDGILTEHQRRKITETPPVTVKIADKVRIDVA